MKKKNKTTTRTIKLGSNYIKFLEAVGKYRHLPYPEYKKKNFIYHRVLIFLILFVII